jgi:hypothetical protein
MPVGQITINDSCPTFITPLIKSLLHKRNKLMRKHQLNKANDLHVKIGKLILEHRSSLLSRVDYRSSKELWAPVKPTLKASSCNRSLSATFEVEFADLDAINEYFANIATDTCYDSCAIEQLIDYLSVSNGSGVLFNVYEVFQLLTEI